MRRAAVPAAFFAAGKMPALQGACHFIEQFSVREACLAPRQVTGVLRNDGTNQTIPKKAVRCMLGCPSGTEIEFSE